jgi:hypothetical protein
MLRDGPRIEQERRRLRPDPDLFGRFLHHLGNPRALTLTAPPAR